MLWAAESIYGGTWGGDALPDEVLHYEIMREMGWSFQDLLNTPVYVLRYTTDLMMIRRQAQADAEEKARRDAERGH